jgi:hypothetical protein
MSASSSFSSTQSRTRAQARAQAQQAQAQGTTTQDTGDMGPSTVDLLMLTFNCAQNLINVAVFANHLQAALNQNATDLGLPDLVVL